VVDTQLRETHRTLRRELGANTVGLDDANGALPLDLALLRHLATRHEHVLGERRETPVARHVHELTSRELGLGLLSPHTQTQLETMRITVCEHTP